MLRFFAISVFLVVAVAGAPSEQQRQQQPQQTSNDQSDLAIGEQFMNGVSQVDNIDLSNLPRKDCSDSDVKEDEVTFMLYTRGRPNGEHIKSDMKNLTRTGFNVKRPIKVLIHGFLQDASWAYRMVRDYLFAHNVHVLVVDWSKYSKECDISSTNRVVTEHVGKTLGQMLQMILALGEAPHRLHLIGFSHGAHIAGIAAKYLAPNRVARITGLDPISQPETAEAGLHKLANGDAAFIDVIVSSIPSLTTEHMTEHEVGDVTFYPNGGLTAFQPECKNIEDYNRKMICSHAVSYKYFAESITFKNKFPAKKCDSWQQFLGGKCEKSQQYVNMGEYVNTSARGKYYLHTAERRPYNTGLWKMPNSE